MSIPTDSNKAYEISNTSEDTVKTTANPFKALAMGLGGLAFFLAIFALLPMFFTYLSEGYVRAPAEIHTTDSAVRLSLKSSSYNNQPAIVLEKQTVPPRKFYNKVPMN